MQRFEMKYKSVPIPVRDTATLRILHCEDIQAPLSDAFDNTEYSTDVSAALAITQVATLMADMCRHCRHTRTVDSG